MHTVFTRSPWAEAIMVGAAASTLVGIVAVRGRLDDVASLTSTVAQRLDPFTYSMAAVLVAFYWWASRPGTPGVVQRWGTARRRLGAVVALAGLPLWVGALLISGFILPHRAHLGGLPFHLADLLICVALYGAASLLIGIGTWMLMDRSGDRDGAAWSVWLWWTMALVVASWISLDASWYAGLPPWPVWLPAVAAACFAGTGGSAWLARRFARHGAGGSEAASRAVPAEARCSAPGC